MKRYRVPVLIAFVLFFSGLLACKKKDNGLSVNNLKIATIDYTHSALGEHYRVVYDAYSNVDSFTIVGDGTAQGNNSFEYFRYFGSSYSITDNNNYTYNVQANTAGQILKVLVTDTLIMHYNGSQLTSLDTKVAQAAYPYYAVTTLYYTWKDGDLVSISPTGGTAKVYYYDKSKSGQAGDALRIGNFLAYGRSYIKTSHLPMGMMTGADTVEKYYYQFEAGTGRISQLVTINKASPVEDTMLYNYRYY